MTTDNSLDEVLRGTERYSETSLTNGERQRKILEGTMRTFGDLLYPYQEPERDYGPTKPYSRLRIKKN
ncbi:hypothetical protein HYS50_02305 [Candidatus Woesearchaeota archaeon]|nr:hypothetical protein [Candidatus Woesearchaeota archaeon]